MPLPNPKVLNAFLDQYIAIRQDTWSSAINSAVSSVAKYAVGVDIQGDRINECEQLKIRFNNTKEIGEWIEIIHDLSKKAKEANHQIYTSDSSLLCETLHAIRSYIVAIMKYTPKSKDTDSTKSEDITKKAFESVIEKLLDKIQKKSQKIRANQKRSADPSSINELKEEKNRTLLMLANLNHQDSIFDAGELNLFDGLKFPGRNDKKLTSNDKVNNSINPNIPWCYQRAFYFIFYEKHFFQHTKKAFKDFLRDALNNPEEVNPVDVEEVLFDVETPDQDIEFDTDDEKDTSSKKSNSNSESRTANSTPGVKASTAGLFAVTGSQDAKEDEESKKKHKKPQKNNEAGR